MVVAPHDGRPAATTSDAVPAFTRPRCSSRQPWCRMRHAP